MILIVTINLFIGYLNSDRIHYRPLPPEIEKDLGHTLHRVERQLKNAKNRHLSHQRYLQRLFLIDENGQEIFNRSIPPIVNALNERVKQEGHIMMSHQKRNVFYGGTQVQLGGKTYRLYKNQRFGLISRHYIGGFFREITKNFFITIFIVSFPLSFILAFMITRPIKALQNTTQKIADNLDDISELQSLSQRRDEFGDLATDFQSMANSLKNNINSQKQLLSDVSHELRSPLTRLQIALGIIEKNQSLPIDLSRIKLEAVRMNDMLNNLLTLSQLEAQTAQTNKESFNLSQLLESIIQDASFEAQQKQINIHSDIKENIHFSGIKTAILSAIENILRNAIRYTQEQGSIHCQLVATDGEIQIYIKDNGPGVAPEYLNKIFDSFYRPQSDRSRATGSVGLGLSIAKRAILLNQGRISAHNIQPHGLKVCIQLPSKS